MGDKIVVGPINQGFKNDRTAFSIDNDSFPTLINAYQWRGRVKRKRGTSFLGRLSRYLGTTDGAGNLVVTILPTPIPIGISSFTIGTDVFVDPGGASPVLLITNSTGTGTLNRTTGVLTITGSIPLTAVIFYPTLPVMGLEDFILTTNPFPGTIAFDTRYAYNINTAFPYSIYDVSFYKNPPTGTYPGYVQKTTVTPTWWNGQTYQQFWTTNYQNALWVTNGITVNFSATNIGMQFKPIAAIAIIAAGPPATATLTIIAHGLVVGDFLFINEVLGGSGINFQTGYVITVTDANNVIVEFPNATLVGPYTANTGIAQYLTNRSDVTKDSLRWYDGDPTNGSPTAPVQVPGNGWVNFAPPLSQLSYSIADLPPAQYYLVGARMILSFKDRLIFVGPVVQTSSPTSQVYLQDTVIYSQNGTPYYTASFTGDPSLATTQFHPILVPINQTSSPTAFWEDVTGFGGFITAGVQQPIITTQANRDELIMGFLNMQTRFVYTGNDIVPFNFYIINSELGSASTFSAIGLDQGVYSRGEKGYVVTGQTQTARIDNDIPDQVFEISSLENGNERFTAIRDFINEWIYFTYPANNVGNGSPYIFPNQTLQYNYRDNSYAILNECYTHYGTFRKQSGFTWATVGLTFPTWSSWNEPWSAGSSTLLKPEIIAGNQQGFVMIRDDGTDEGNSLYVQNIVNSTVTSPNHTLNNGDFIIITGAFGSVGENVNGKIFSVSSATANDFVLNPTIPTSTYLGGASILRMYRPFVQTKQFPTAWGMARKTRLGNQQYLLTTTDKSQIQLLIFLSQNSDYAYNDSLILPDINSVNDSLTYSTVLYTCPESTNLGLTPANVNLQMPTASTQAQIWHRMNTSLLGDTVQIGFTLSDIQMRSFDIVGTPFAITGATQANPAVLTTTGLFSIGQQIKIVGVVGMTQLNNKVFNVLSSTPTTVTIEVNSTTFSAYVSDGTATLVAPINQFAEIELHGFILDVSPSMLLV